ncbi:ATP-binding protein [Marinagarivorans cellulosilyticus]|uniref:histidine kinase n=1 Tax=Marinagarivorans cellulosilyticus TaxID=2721545 RepID=A0AAN1WEH1_9GAMM|nr:ATP-binding protein [Marinagarivorans cellulosilyticus]BCD96114.1 two-component system sensor histidine kinase [Marinagarivorans cellulosilyticus]
MANHTPTHEAISGASVIDSDKQHFSSTLVRILEQVETLRGNSFIERITPLLAETIQADYTFVGLVDASFTRADSLCLCEGTRIIDNIQYALLGTPCQGVVEQNLCIHTSGVCDAFPEDNMLAELGVQGYIGAPLFAPDGGVFGLIVALFKKPIAHPEPVQTLFSVFSGRIAAEIVGAQAQRSLEAELEKSKKLQEQYQLLARQERDARHRAQKANRVKSAFVANMSHEVKTPMNAMLAFCQMLLKSELNQSQRLQVQSMLDAGQQLMTMLNDVLELSRLEDGIVELPEQDVLSHQLLDDVVEQAASQLQQKPIKFGYSIAPTVPPKLLMAEHHVQKVVVNLLSNALKFTQKGEIHVQMDFTLGEQDVGSLTITVADTGVGIDQQFIGDIFEPFTQQNVSNTRAYGGAGLGLHLAYRLVKTMGGTIDVESVLGQGSVFTLSLPVVLSDAPAARASNVEAAIGLVSLQGDALITENALRFLGVAIHRIDNRVPLSLQLGQTPIAGLVIDASCDLAESGQLAHWLAEAGSEKLPVAVVASKDVVHIASVREQLVNVTCVQAPVLMHEWLDVVEGLAGKSNASQSVNGKAGERILLVEDNRLNQEIALCILEDAGYRVDVANNGQEAVDTMESSPDVYQLVLMDIQMPVMDGLEATRIIRGRLRSHVPIVAVTAGIAVQDRQQCDEVGMDDFIPKPIDEDFVLQKVRYYMSGAHQTQ